MIAPTIKKYMIPVCMAMISTITIHAQQRPSERPMASGIQQINEKRAERNAYISRSQQAAATAGQSGATPAVPAQAGTVKPGSNNNILPSQKPIQRPTKPIIRKTTVMPADTIGRGRG